MRAMFILDGILLVLGAAIFVAALYLAPAFEQTIREGAFFFVLSGSKGVD